MQIKLPEEDFSYGIPTKVSTPIKNIMKNDYGNDAERNCVDKYVRWAI